MAGTAALLGSRSVPVTARGSAHVVAPPRRAGRPSGQGRLRPPTRRRRVAAPHLVAAPGCGPRPKPLPVVVLVGLAVATALSIFWFGSFAGSVADADVPAATTVVRVAPGESLSELAARMAPDSDTAAVVAKIRELNGLTDAAVRAGRPLTVPFAP